MIEVSVEDIASLTQYYDQSFRCFTFGDFQLTIEKFEGILGCPIGGRKPYLFSGYYPSMAKVARVVKISERELDQLKQSRNGVAGILRKCLEEKVETHASQGKRVSFMDVLALLVTIFECKRTCRSSSDRCFSCLSSQLGKLGHFCFGICV